MLTPDPQLKAGKHGSCERGKTAMKETLDRMLELRREEMLQEPLPSEVRIPVVEDTGEHLLRTQQEHYREIKETAAHFKEVSSASQILLDAAETVKQRGVDYNNPTGERSMAQIVAMFNLLTGKDLTTLEGWQFMILLKLVRGQKSPNKIDSWLDLAGYAGLAGEEGAK